MSKGNNNNLKTKIMRQEDVVGRKVLVRLRALPREEQEQRVTEPVFDRFSIVEVIGYNWNNTREVIIDGKSLGWLGCVLRVTDVTTREAETYWYVALSDIVTVLE